MSFPKIVATIEMLRRHQQKEGYSNAQLVTQLNAFGWTWQEDLIADLMTGRKKPTADQGMFFKRYLLKKFYDYNCDLVAE